MDANTIQSSTVVACLLVVWTVADGLTKGAVLDEGAAQLVLLDPAVLVAVQQLEHLADRLERVL